MTSLDRSSWLKVGGLSLRSLVAGFDPTLAGLLASTSVAAPVD